MSQASVTVARCGDPAKDNMDEGLIVILRSDGGLARPGCLASPTHLAEVRWGSGMGEGQRRGREGTARRLDVTEITRESEAAVLLISRSL